MIARKRKHMLGRNLTLVTVLSNLNPVCRYLQNARIQIWCYLALLETLLDIRTNPILHRGSKFCPARYQRNTAAASEQFERGLHARILPSDPNDIPVVQRM